MSCCLIKNLSTRKVLPAMFLPVTKKYTLKFQRRNEHSMHRIIFLQSALQNEASLDEL
jgi:hypothetical protein